MPRNKTKPSVTTVRLPQDVRDLWERCAEAERRSLTSTGAAIPDERKELREVVGKMNDLFSGNISEADFVGALTAWRGHLLANETLAEQAKNNSEEQFAMGDFKDVLTGIVIDAQDAQNNIADQLLKDERIFGVMQRMLAKMVWQQFQQAASR